MAQVTLNIAGFGALAGDAPIVILGPNGSGKTQLAQRIAQSNKVSAISAQRRTWVDDSLPVQEDEQLQNNVRAHIDRWRQHSWQPTEEINFILSTLIQDHTSLLTRANEVAIASGQDSKPITDTKLIRLQTLWNRLFPKRKLEIGGFFPRVRRLDAEPNAPTYHLRQMSDGERTILYMTARIMTAEHPVILVDEPELHMHSRLSVQFWDEAEKMRPDCRFVYVTHDLTFALSRRRSTVLIARSGESAESVLVDELPATVAAEVLGAATLPFYAKRIYFFEGESGKGFASELFSIWFDDDATFAVPAGSRDAVCAAVSGLKAVGVVAAEVGGIVDRDFYSDAALAAVPPEVTTLPLHEIESIVCDPAVIAALAEHFGKDPTEIYNNFLHRVRNEFRGQTLSGVVARRVRAQVGDLLDGAFGSAQIVADMRTTASNHGGALMQLDLPAKADIMFREEQRRVEGAITAGSKDMLAILPGKHLLGLLGSVLGLASTSELTGLITRSLDKRRLKEKDPLLELGTKIESAISSYLPARRTPA